MQGSAIAGPSAVELHDASVSMKLHAREIALRLSNLDVVATADLSFERISYELLAMYGQKQYGQATTVLTLELIEACASLNWAERFYRLIVELLRLLLAIRSQQELAPLALLWRLLSCLVHSEMAPRWSPFLLYLCHRSANPHDVLEMSLALQRNPWLKLMVARTLREDPDGAIACDSLQVLVGERHSEQIVERLVSADWAAARHVTPASRQDGDELLLVDLLDCINLPSPLELRQQGVVTDACMGVRDFEAATRWVTDSVEQLRGNREPSTATVPYEDLKGGLQEWEHAKLSAAAG